MPDPQRQTVSASEVAALVTALRPFAAITRSTMYAEDEDEPYDAVLSNQTIGSERADFTGQDIERARDLIAKHRPADKPGEDTG